ncbi:hypothetical protein STRNTR1_1662 [Stenotrophomonas maltophilia]|nr:hypothetical protein STRNTR1_1662 [Stenotrophomonas maltophilia]
MIADMRVQVPEHPMRRVIAVSLKEKLNSVFAGCSAAR